MSNDLAVRLRRQHHTSRDELVSQRCEVFDDAVVDNGDPSVVTDMRMCVVVGWSSVGGPPGVPDTRSGLWERVLADEGLEIDELARLLPDLKAPFTDHRHAGRVITAVLKATQPGYHDFQGLLFPDVPDNPAHGDKTTPAPLTLAVHLNDALRPESMGRRPPEGLAQGQIHPDNISNGIG